MRKLNVIQVGVRHEHAGGKYETLKKMGDIFNLVGVVDEKEFAHTPFWQGSYYVKALEQERVMTLEEALAYPSLDLVLIEVPNNDLVPVAMRFAEKGVAMHVDKPCGESLAPYKKLLETCETKHIPFQMGYMFRGNPAVLFAIDCCRKKVIGDVYDFEADMNHGYGGETYQDYIRNFSGGLMYNLGCHLIDIMVAIMGRPDKVAPFLKTAPGDAAGTFNNCTAVFDYQNGGLGVIRSCSRHAECTQWRQLRISGTNGSIMFLPIERFNGKPIEVNLYLKEAAGGFNAGINLLKFGPQDDRYAPQLIELAQMICGEKEDSWTRSHDLLVHETVLRAAAYGI